MADILQTYILKVNIGCCNACPKTLEKLLIKNKGVESFEIYEEKNIVTVTGKINLHQLFKDIKKKIKKNAELIKKESADSGKKESADSGKKEGEKSLERIEPPVHVSHIPGAICCVYPESMQMPPALLGSHYQWMMEYAPPYAFRPPTYNH